MTAHKHHVNMMLYAQDAAETDTPWDRWDYKGRVRWINVQGGMHPQWYPDAEYRRKPKTIRIGERDVPEPMRVAPAMGSTYYIVDYSYAEHNAYHHWQNDEYDNIMLQSGLCHATEKAAIAHAEALILISGGTL